MKIFFSGSIRGGRDDLSLYKDIVKFLKTKGEVLSEFVADEDIQKKEKENDISDDQIFKGDVNLISKCDVLIAEVTTPSLGVGYEIRTAESFNKRIICLFRENDNVRLSPMINGNNKVKVIRYKNFKDLKDKLMQIL